MQCVCFEDERLKVTTLPVQQQEGSNDCGLFCIAYAVELCNRKNPEECRFEQTHM